MNTIAGWMLAAVLTLPTVGMAQINALPSQPHLLVKGQAFRTVDPDRFIVDLKISKTELQPDLARKFVEDRASWFWMYYSAITFSRTPFTPLHSRFLRNRVMRRANPSSRGPGWSAGFVAPLLH